MFTGIIAFLPALLAGIALWALFIHLIMRLVRARRG